ncbi:multiple inositol polyphosphate phosphatase 1-like [Leguminivora glycinivorella]|uniref:multiple inositol polyphosphate phosphatase 1-like n=1 Tax=Leguminivora glycinivorella TaxID=1035111 RepID=UPI00200C422E|nr:multiple inositol polyphosphate phosphatase 1-like [Leguminivora glycinivorella]
MILIFLGLVGVLCAGAGAGARAGARAGADESCYWNRPCPYLLHSTKTAYETVRGDIRDYPDPESCEAVSVWSLHRHGNRNPGSSSVDMKRLIDIVQPQILQAFQEGRSQLCAQDIEAFRNWTFDATMIEEQAYLTETGYQELSDIGKRLRERYPHLARGTPQEYYLRPTNSQRTIASVQGFLEGFTEGTNLNITYDGPFERDDVIRSYANCDKYQQDIKNGPSRKEQLEIYEKTAEYVAVQKAVQERLGISYQLTAPDVYTLYEICRYHRTWSPSHQDAWCATLSDADLVVLEYRDDVRHYYKNGYGSWVNERLAGPLLKDLRVRMEAAANGTGQRLVSYFSHNAMTEMAIVALGLFRDAAPAAGATRDPSRTWRTSFIGAFSTNMIVVLNRCTESGTATHRVQFFINEKPTELCPLAGCSWQQFQELVGHFEDSLEFCSLDYPEPGPAPGAAPARAAALLATLGTLVISMSNVL